VTKSRTTPAAEQGALTLCGGRRSGMLRRRRVDIHSDREDALTHYECVSTRSILDELAFPGITRGHGPADWHAPINQGA